MAVLERQRLDLVNITGATTATYTPVTADPGKLLRIAETATDADGGPSVTSNSPATAAVVPGAPTGFTFAPATSSLQALQGSSNLSANTTVGKFNQTGGVAGHSFTYTLAGSSAFSLTSSGNQGTLSTGASAVAANTVAALTVQLNDVTTGTHSSPLPFDIVVGGSGANTINLATLGIASSTPTMVYGLAGKDTLNATGMTGSTWLTGGAGADTMTGGTGTNTYLYAAAGELHANRLRHHRQLQSDPRQDRPDRHRNNRAIVPDNPSLNHCCCSIDRLAAERRKHVRLRQYHRVIEVSWLRQHGDRIEPLDLAHGRQFFAQLRSYLDWETGSSCCFQVR